MIEGKRVGEERIYNIIFASVLIISVLFMFNSVKADTTFLLNITTGVATGQVNFTQSFNSSAVAGTNSLINAFVQEDVKYVYNFSISHYAATLNLTQINFTLPAGFRFEMGSDKTANFSSTPYLI